MAQVTVDFSSETMEFRKQWSIFKVLLKKEKTVNENSLLRDYLLQKLKKTKRICSQHTWNKRIAKGSSTEKREMIPEGNLKHYKWRNSNKKDARRNSTIWHIFYQKYKGTPFNSFWKASNILIPKPDKDSTKTNNTHHEYRYKVLPTANKILNKILQIKHSYI